MEKSGNIFSEKEYQMGADEVAIIKDFVRNAPEAIQAELLDAIAKMHMQIVGTLGNGNRAKISEDTMKGITVKIHFSKIPTVHEVSKVMKDAQEVYLDSLSDHSDAVREAMLNVSLEEVNSKEHHISHFEEGTELENSFLLHFPTTQRIRILAYLETLYEKILNFFDEEEVQIIVDRDGIIRFQINGSNDSEEFRDIGLDMTTTLGGIHRFWDGLLENILDGEIQSALHKNVSIVVAQEQQE